MSQYQPKFYGTQNRSPLNSMATYGGASYAPQYQSYQAPLPQQQRFGSNSAIEYIPYQRTVVDYEPVVQYVPRERQVLDYYTVEHDVHYQPQREVERYIDYAPVERVQERVMYQPQHQQRVVGGQIPVASQVPVVPTQGVPYQGLPSQVLPPQGYPLQASIGIPPRGVYGSPQVPYPY